MFKYPEKNVRIINTPVQLTIAIMLGVLLGIGTWTSPQGVMIGLGAIVASIIFLRRPEFAIISIMILLTTIIPETRIPIINIGPGRLYISELIVMGMLGIIIIRWLVDPEVKLARTPIGLSLLAFYGWAILSTALAIVQSTVDISMAIPEIRSLSYYMLFFIVINLVIEKKHIKLLINGFFFLATITSIAMIVQYVVGVSLPFISGRVEILESSANITRITDTPGEALITIAVIMKSIIILTNKIRWDRIGDFIQWGLYSVALVMTFNRTHWIMVAIAIIFTFYLVQKQEKKKFIYWVILLFILLFMVIMIASATPEYRVSNFINTTVQRFLTITSISSYTDTKVSTLQWRDFEYKFGFPQIFSHPIIGLGLGAEYRPTLPEIDHPGFAGESYTHNGLLWIAMKTGIIGFILMMFMFINLIVRGFRNWKKINDPFLRSIFLGTTLMFLGLIIGSNIHPLVITIFWTPLLGIFMGLNESILRVNNEPGEISALNK